VSHTLATHLASPVGHGLGFEDYCQELMTWALPSRDKTKLWLHCGYSELHTRPHSFMMCSMALSLAGRNLLVLSASPSLVCVNVYPCCKKPFLPPFVARLHALVRRDKVSNQWNTVYRSLWRDATITRENDKVSNPGQKLSYHKKLTFRLQCLLRSPTAIEVPGAKTGDSLCQSSNFRHMYLCWWQEYLQEDLHTIAGHSA